MGTAIAVAVTLLCAAVFIARRQWFCLWLAVLTLAFIYVTVPA